MKDLFNLQRFVEAQEPIFEQVLAELSQGRKRSHWMWFIFPQIRGLGHSLMAQRYAISSLEEARAYLVHPVLGPRLRECVKLLMQVEGPSIQQILGWPDYLKFRSSLTLFAQATGDNQIFLDALEKFYGGEPDPLTLERL